jgi:hypothetical protein
VNPTDYCVGHRSGGQRGQNGGIRCQTISYTSGGETIGRLLSRKAARDVNVPLVFALSDPSISIGLPKTSAMASKVAEKGAPGKILLAP